MFGLFSLKHVVFHKSHSAPSCVWSKLAELLRAQERDEQNAKIMWVWKLRSAVLKWDLSVLLVQAKEMPISSSLVIFFLIKC